MTPKENLHRLHMCSSHYDHLIKTRRKNNCELCKIVRKKSTCNQNLSLLRALSKGAAIGLWISQGLSCYQYWTCTECRHYIERTYLTEETKKFADQLYGKMYDDFNELVMTPLVSPMSSPSSEYRPLFDESSSTNTVEMMRALQHLLRDQHFALVNVLSLGYPCTEKIVTGYPRAVPLTLSVNILMRVLG